MADKLLDLRQCQYPGADFSAKVLSGGLMSDADFSNTTLIETVLTKVGAVSRSHLLSPAPGLALAYVSLPSAAGVCCWGKLLRWLPLQLLCWHHRAVHYIAR